MIGRLGTILKWIILLPVLIAVVLLAVANDQSVTVHLNPFDTSDPVLKVEAPLYQVGFAVFVLGALIGALIAWMGQLRHRSRIRRQHEERPAWEARRAAPTRHDDVPHSPSAAYLPRPERS